MAYNPAMIWIPVAVSLLVPLALIGVGWFAIRSCLIRFQADVLGVLGEEIRKQDDRNRKGRAADAAKNDDGKVEVSFNNSDSKQLIEFYPGASTV